MSPTATIHTTTSAAVSVRLRLSVDPAGIDGVVYTNAVTPSPQGDATHSTAGLAPGSVYYYRVAMTDTNGVEVLDTKATVGRIKTAPNGPSNFNVCFGSCTNASDSASFAAINARQDDLFLHLGDLYYNDGGGTAVSTYRTQMVNKITVANHAAVFATIPTAYIPSDHDFAMANDGNGTLTPAAVAPFNQVYREKWPATLGATTTGVYHTFAWGRVRFIMLDTLTFKSDPAITDNSSKTMLGATQKAWVKSVITSSTEPVLIFGSDVPWTGTTLVGGAQWNGFNTERQEMASFINASGKKGFFLSGDMHAVATNSGAATTQGIPDYQAAPFQNTSSIKATPWDAVYPTAAGSSVSQYGRMAITDTGAQITIAFTGYSSDNTARVSRTDVITTGNSVVRATTNTVTAVGLIGSVSGKAVSRTMTGAVAAAGTVTVQPTSGITLAGSPTLYENAAGTAVVIPTPAGVVSGELLVAVVAVTRTSTGGTLSSPSGWVTIGTVADTDSAGLTTGMYYRVATGTESGSYTWTASESGRISGSIQRFAGINASVPLDSNITTAYTTSGQAVTTVVAPSVTTVDPNAVLISVASEYAATADDFTVPSGMTMITNTTGTGRRMTWAYQKQGTAGASGSKTWTQVGTGQLPRGTILASITPSGGVGSGGAPPPPPPPPPGGGLPIGNIGRFTQIVAQDFNTPFAKGQLRTALPGWDCYDGIFDHSRHGTYTMSQTYAHDGLLDIFIGWDGAKYAVANIMPNGYRGQVHGKITWKMQTDSIQYYKLVPLWWSAADVWADGEIDFPEGGIGGSPMINVHQSNRTLPSNPAVNEFQFNMSPLVTTGLHIYDCEWTSTAMVFSVDGNVIATCTYASKPRAFPVNPMVFHFQFEVADESGGTTPSQSATGHIYIHWVAQYTWA